MRSNLRQLKAMQQQLSFVFWQHLEVQNDKFCKARAQVEHRHCCRAASIHADDDVMPILPLTLPQPDSLLSLLLKEQPAAAAAACQNVCSNAEGRTIQAGS